MKLFSRDARITYALAALSGILLALAFPYPAIGALAWIGLVPLLSAIQRSDLRVAPLLGLIAGVVFFSILLYWILIFGVIAWVALSIFLSLTWMLFAAGAWVALRSYGPMGQAVVIPSLWVVVEFVRSLGPLGFAWGNLGSTVGNPFLLSIASYIGELGLGSVIVLANVVMFQLAGAALSGMMTWARLRAAGAGALILITVVVALPVIGGAASKFPARSSKAINVAVIQPNIPQSVKLDTNNNHVIKAVHLGMTRDALKEKPDLIVWPESTLVSYINDERDLLAELKRTFTKADASIIFGGVYNDSGKASYNSALFFDGAGPMQTYHKIHLVPFGEHVPLRGLVERINSMASLVNDYAPGREHKVFDMRSNGQFSTVICFESSDTALVGKMVRNGARMLVVITNDGWFGTTAAADQHFRITRMRAAEYGIPVVQAANTGISGVIDGDGRVVARTQLNERTVLQEAVAFSSRPSFFAHYGYLVPYLYVAVALVAVALRIPFIHWHVDRRS